MLSKLMGKKLNICVSDYCVFDLETTGTSPARDAIIEISAVKVKDGKVVDEFSTLVNPMIPIPYYATAVNGIIDDMVSEAPKCEEALKDFLDFVGDMVLVGHNIHLFDMKFICRDAKEFWGMNVGNDYVDTLPLARKCLPQLAHHTLTDLAKHYDIGTEGAHRALFDCHMNRMVFENLREDMKNASETAKEIPLCPQCGNVLKIRNGKFGEFWGCSSYPTCRFTMNVKK